MEKGYEIAQIILNGNEQRINFFIKKITEDLKKLGINNYDELKIRNIIIESAKNYTKEEKLDYYNYLLKTAKNTLGEGYSTYYQNTKYFNKPENTVIAYCLNKINGRYLTNEEIAETLGISQFDVVNIIYRLKELYRTNQKSTIEIYGDVKVLLNKRNKEDHPRKKTQVNTNILTDEDINIIAYYTGQIDGLCLDTEEISKKINSKDYIIEEKINKIYNLLNIKENYDKLIEKYPDIEELLYIRGKKINANLTYLPNEIKNKVDKVKKEKKKVQRNNINEEIKVLKWVLQDQKEDKEIAELLNIKKESVYYKKKKLFAKLEDKTYKEKVLEEYPTITEDLKIYNEKNVSQTKEVTTKDTNAKKVADFFKLLCTKENNKYKTAKELAEILNIKPDSVFAKKYLYLKKIQDLEFRKRVKIYYETLDEDLNAYQNHNKKEKEEVKKVTKKEKISQEEKVANFFKLILKKKEDNTHYTNKELEEILNMKYSAIYKRKKDYLKYLENEEFKNKVLLLYPTLNTDLEDFINLRPKRFSYSKRKVKKDENKKEKTIAKFLDRICSKKEDNTFYTDKELQKKYNYKTKTLENKRYSIISKLNNEEIRKKVFSLTKITEKQYNEYISFYKETIKNKRDENNLKEFLNFFEIYLKRHENDTFYTVYELAKILDIQPGSINTKKWRLLKLIEDEDFKNKVLEKYPNFQKDLDEKNKAIKNPTNKKQVAKYKINKERKIALFLRQIYEKKEDNTYRTKEELEEILNKKYENIENKLIRIKPLLEDEEFLKKVLENYPNYLIDKEEYEKNKQEKLLLDDVEILKIYYNNRDYNEVAESLNVTKTVAKNKIKKIIKKLDNEEYLIKVEKYIENIRIYLNKINVRSITITQEELINIRKNSRHYDLPQVRINTKDLLIQGINELENSIYKEYIELCTYEQKAMIALSLGYFQNTKFSNEDIAELFNTNIDEVKYLITECLQYPKDIKVYKKK